MNISPDGYSEFFHFGPERRNKEHQYLKFSNEREKDRIPNATYWLISQYVQSTKQAHGKWKKDRKFWTVNWEKDGTKNTSDPINYSVILNSIKKHIVFRPAALNLPIACEPFLDITTSLGVTEHRVLDDGRPQLHISPANSTDFLGENYPIHPVLSQEGIIVNSFLNAYFNRIANYKITVVNESNNPFSFEWFFLLKDLINDAIASIEITLHLIYDKAMFDPKPSWTFNQERLGSKYGRRFKDKLCWIHEIAGKPFDLVQEVRESLYWLQELRNHLNHFDPPSFCIALEECAMILNAITDVALVHIKMRQTLGLKLSVNLINLTLFPPVLFVPEDEYSKRANLDFINQGYNTSRWEPRKN